MDQKRTIKNRNMQVRDPAAVLSKPKPFYVNKMGDVITSFYVYV